VAKGEPRSVHKVDAPALFRQRWRGSEARHTVATFDHSSGAFLPQTCKSPFIRSRPSCIGVGGKHANG
jgi:hypothetical protein